MHPNAQLIEKFYAAFQSRNADAMCACYHPEVTFTDPAFGTLRGARVASMWRMLCERGKDLRVTFSNVQADETRGSAHWEAKYTFSKSRRPVHNVIEAEFVFKDGLIYQHTDRFNMWKWSSMALGVTGALFGWTPFVQSAIRREALKGLEKFMEKNGLAQNLQGKYADHDLLKDLEEEHRREIKNEDEFDAILEKAHEQAKRAGLKRADVSKAVTKTRSKK